MLCANMLRTLQQRVSTIGTLIARWPSMKIAIPVWQDRISPVFDVAGQLLLVDVADGQEVAREVQVVDESTIEERVRRVVELSVEALICAGISQALETALAERGIRVIARICGDVNEVLAAFQAGRLSDERFAMPGCCGQRRQRHRGGCQRRGRFKP
jgi:predicted Fe-Mo cluster-binding NifX family protein